MCERRVLRWQREVIHRVDHAMETLVARLLQEDAGDTPTHDMR